MNEELEKMRKELEKLEITELFGATKLIRCLMHDDYHFTIEQQNYMGHIWLAIKDCEEKRIEEMQHDHDSKSRKLSRVYFEEV